MEGYYRDPSGIEARPYGRTALPDPFLRQWRSTYPPVGMALVRHVEDSDPHNPDVVYNKGHLLQQHTFFLGDVNFYYEVRGVK